MPKVDDRSDHGGVQERLAETAIERHLFLRDDDPVELQEQNKRQGHNTPTDQALARSRAIRPHPIELTERAETEQRRRDVWNLTNVLRVVPKFHLTHPTLRTPSARRTKSTPDNQPRS